MSIYLKIYLATMFVLLVFLSLFILFLYRAGELVDLNEIVMRQRASSEQVVYGTAVNANIINYKRTLLKMSNPKVVALGSSRVMQFRESMFNEQFINLGGGMSSIDDGLGLLSEIINKKPEVVVLGLDIWWFNDKFQKPSSVDFGLGDINVSNDFNPSQIYKVVKWLMEGKISSGMILNSVLHGVSSSRIGLLAMYNDGFGRDGSYYYSRRITGKTVPDDTLFKDTLSRMDNGNRRFQYGEFAHNTHIEKMKKLISLLDDAGIHVVTFFPPFSPTINDVFSENSINYKYIQDIKLKLNKVSVSFHDLSNPNEISSSDCEFIDGFHGGDVTYSRILLKLGTEDTTLGSKINMVKLGNDIVLHDGSAFIPDSRVENSAEVDFNRLGCPKA